MMMYSIRISFSAMRKAAFVKLPMAIAMLYKVMT